MTDPITDAVARVILWLNGPDTRTLADLGGSRPNAAPPVHRRRPMFRRAA